MKQAVSNNSDILRGMDAKGLGTVIYLNFLFLQADLSMKFYLYFLLRQINTIQVLLIKFLIAFCCFMVLGTDLKNKKTTKQEFHQENYCFLVEQFYMGQ